MVCCTVFWVFGNPCGQGRPVGVIPGLSRAPYRARMRDRDLYAQILGINSPWHVSDVRLDVPAGKVEVILIGIRFSGIAGARRTSPLEAVVSYDECTNAAAVPNFTRLATVFRRAHSS